MDTPSATLFREQPAEHETVATVLIQRRELEHERSLLIARLRLLNQWLGYPMPDTGKEQRRNYAKHNGSDY